MTEVRPGLQNIVAPAAACSTFAIADTAYGVAVGSDGHVVIYAPVILGDLNGDEEITPADVVLELNKVFLDSPIAPPEEVADVNCDGNFSPSDVVLMLHRAFLGTPFPCELAIFAQGNNYAV